ncbi:MAG: UDP-3-O-(3-hydroxymyristoyl)glucosamine N-acyltransferase [Gammaproteobacteria bacterium]
MKKCQQYTLAELTQGLDITIKGDPNCIIKGVCTIQEPQADQITFLVNPLYKKYLASTQAAAVILSEEDAQSCPVNAIIARNPYYIYAKIAAFFNPKSDSLPGIHATAVIGNNCEIDPSASIAANCVLAEGVKIAAGVVVGPGCVIGEYTKIDKDSHLDANVTIYDRVTIHQRVRISSGAVIGSDGFGFAKQKGFWHKVPQLGSVIIHDDVEIGANSTIDRGAIDNTVIEKGVKLDNLIQVGHNVLIGENTAIAGCVAIAGSAVIGKNCLIGGCTGIAGHITIADNVVITGGTEVSKSIREPGIYSSGIGGVVTNMERRKNTARVNRLEQLMERVKVLESTLQEITERDVT